MAGLVPKPQKPWTFWGVKAGSSYQWVLQGMGVFNEEVGFLDLSSATFYLYDLQRVPVLLHLHFPFCKTVLKIMMAKMDLSFAVCQLLP
jgi:hypothetical protein